MEKTNSNSPVTNTVMVRLLAPFHSFKTIPQKLLNKMFNDIRMLHEKASITGASAKKLLPMPKPKNCEYQSRPANAQNSTLFVKVELGTER